MFHRLAFPYLYLTEFLVRPVVCTDVITCYLFQSHFDPRLTPWRPSTQQRPTTFIAPTMVRYVLKDLKIFVCVVFENNQHPQENILTGLKKNVSIRSTTWTSKTKALWFWVVGPTTLVSFKTSPKYKSYVV